jgi:hypothetical protein
VSEYGEVVSTDKGTKQYLLVITDACEPSQYAVFSVKVDPSDYLMTIWYAVIARPLDAGSVNSILTFVPVIEVVTVAGTEGNPVGVIET